MLYDTGFFKRNCATHLLGWVITISSKNWYFQEIILRHVVEEDVFSARISSWLNDKKCTFHNKNLQNKKRAGDSKQPVRPVCRACCIILYIFRGRGWQGSRYRVTWIDLGEKWFFCLFVSAQLKPAAPLRFSVGA